jgi:hypothetical protein
MADTTSHSSLHHTVATMIHEHPFLCAKKPGSAVSLGSTVSSQTRCRLPGLSLVLVLCGVLFQVTAFAPASSRQTPLKSVAEECKTPFLFGRSTKCRMVVDIADSVIEKATTRMVLDQILDESLRTSARKPIMYQFDPSSRAVCSHVYFPIGLTLFSNYSIMLMCFPCLLFRTVLLELNNRFGAIGKEPSFPRLGGRESGTLLGPWSYTSFFGAFQHSKTLCPNFLCYGGKPYQSLPLPSLSLSTKPILFGNHVC